MFLAVDIGNSNIVVGIFKNDEWLHTFRYETKEIQPEYYYESALRNLFLEWSIASSDISKSVLSSVVPDMNEVILNAIESVTGNVPLLIGPEIYKTLDLHIPHPYEIGSDLVCNAYAALKKYGDRCIIVDFGTALTFTVSNKEKGIIGVTIAPGLKTAISSLSSNTAQLPLVPMEMPDSAIGHDTVSAIQAGVFKGYVGLVNEIIKSMIDELNEPYKVIATGGLSAILHPLEHTFDTIDKMLTLEGSRLIYEHSKGIKQS
jgi:type III pantothenate kinase